jgi:tryptophan synthase alpha chain
VKRIGDVFKRKERSALIAYLTVGYPDIETTLKAVPALAGSGCDIIELGIPFSDPLADGVTIQAASYRALQNGVTTRKCLEVAAELSGKVDVPLVFMTYYNPVYSYGLEKFCGDCAGSGVSGLIIPDLIPEEGAEMEESARKHGIDVIYLLAPTSTDERVRLVAGRSEGFIYLVSVTGITGARESLPADLEKFVGRVREETKKPLCVGFGISTPEQAAQVARIADGVIVGSRIIRCLEDDEPLRAVADFTGELRNAIDRRDAG